MSGRLPSGRLKRPERETTTSADARGDSSRTRHDLKADTGGFGKSVRGGATDRSPSYRVDRGRLGRDRRDEREGRRFGGSVYDKTYSRGRSHLSEGSDDGKDNVRKQADSKAFIDDSHLSKLIRKIGREDDRERRLQAARQLKEYLQIPENVKMILKASDNLLVVLQDVFYERTYKEVKQEISACLGMVGYAMGRDSQRYIEWTFTNLSASPSDEIKILLLNSLLEMLKFDITSHKLLDVMPAVITNCQTVLESADTPDFLMAIVDVVLHVVEHHPHIFASHFRDTVDILVGWHIDAMQKENLTAYTAEALVSFHQFWVADLNFSITLLGQFLEDMEAYAEDLSLGLSGEGVDEDLPTPEQCIVKIGALVRVLNTVMRSLGDYFTPNKTPAVTLHFMTDLVERTVRCIEGALAAMYSEKVYIAANNCLLFLVTNLGSDAAAVCQPLTEYLMKQCNNPHIPSYNYTLSFLRLMQKVLDSINTQLSVKFISHILNHDSAINSLRTSHNGQVLSELLKVYRGILGLKSVPLMEEAYKYILGDLEVAFNHLLMTVESDNVCSLVSGNPFSSVIYSTKQAETVIIFDVCALADIGNTKNNIIGMWALSPSIFDLFSKHLLPSHPGLMERYPAVQYAILQALYSHCSRHGHFITSSSLITHNTILEGSLLANVSPATGDHFSTALALLGDLLTCENTAFDSRLLSLTWSQEIIETLQSTQHIYQTQPFHQLVDALVTAGYTCHDELCLLACRSLTKLLGFTNKIKTNVLQRCLDLCTTRLTHTNSRIRQAYQILLHILPLEVTTSHQFGPVQTISRTRKTEMSVSSSETFWLARRSHMAKVSSGTFHSHNFRAIMGYLLYDIAPKNSANLSWLKNIYYSSQRSDKHNLLKDDSIQLDDLVGGSESLLWFWSLWEAAQFCILSKLRTPLGKPQETFTAIESVLKKYAADARKLESEDVIGNRNSGDFNSDGDTGHSRNVVNRVFLLLEYMELLEKQLYNAYEGCAVAMVNPPKAVRTFFRTNRGTCLEWLTRIRPCLITIGRHSGDPALVVRHTFQLLQEMKDNNKTQVPEFEEILMECVEALSYLRCPDAIQGLYVWSREVLGHRLPWIKAAMELASGRYEIAINEFKSSLRQYIRQDAERGEGKDDGMSVAGGSTSSTPSTSPRHLTEGIQKLSLLGCHDDGDSHSNDKADPLVAQYMVNQVSLCYERLCRWDDILAWQETLQQYRSEHTGTPLQTAFALNVDINSIQALARFDSLDYKAARDDLELVPGGSLQSLGNELGTPSLLWDVHEVVTSANTQLLRLLLTFLLDEKHDGLAEYFAGPLGWCEALQTAACLQWPTQLSQNNTLVMYPLHLCKQQFTPNSKPKTWHYPVCDSLELNPQQHDASLAVNALCCIDLQQQIQDHARPEKGADFWVGSSKIRLATVNLARKQQNLVLAEKLLVEEILGSLGSISESEKHLEGDENIYDSLLKLQNARDELEQTHCLRLEREGAKLLRMKEPAFLAIETLCTTSLHHARAIAALNPTRHKHLVADCRDLNSRSLLAIVQWLQTDAKYLSQLTEKLSVIGQEGNGGRVVSDLRALLELERNKQLLYGDVELEEEEDEMHISDNPILGESDTILGRLLHLATLQSPNLAKAWFSLAGWCYKWGRKAVDHATHGTVELSVDEKASILDILPKGVSAEETEGVLTILSQIHTASSNEEDICDQDQTLYDDGAETTRRQLLSSCLSLQIASDDCVDRLVDLWRGVVRRVYYYYQLSAKAYFIYLKLNGVSNRQLTNMDGNITATLRVLRLLVKHAWELRETLEDGLAHTPTVPWKGIIPQLFSRLNHPEPYVRQSVSDLLCRVAHDAPHLIVYPAVVGCSSSKVKDADRDGLLNEYLLENDDEERLETDNPQPITADDDDTQTEDANTDMLQNCFLSIVDTLAKTNPRMIAEVQLLVEELRRVTLLPDELWLGTLNTHHADITRRLQQLEKEVRKVNANASLTADEKTAIIREKHKTVIKPTLYTMERLWEITSKPPETTHETWFQETYGQFIRDALAKLRDPPDPSHPALTWQLFKQLHHSLQQRAQKRTSLVLNMEEMSPKLANLRNTVISMPGATSDGQVVTIDGIHNTVQILPTKTKPKKLIFLGSDGKKHPYLFKGLEDLHLDERIMQFLAIVNNMFAKANKVNSHLYHARHYSVTPLGARSGLIQWVNGATPLFSLYKRWQQREALILQLKQSGNVATPPAIPRPSEVFYNKLTPALKEKGIPTLDNRKDWPLAVQRKVLQDLIAETPGDLLAKELWCSSTSPLEWWQLTQTYCRSTAVMSMIGYFIGLGDRHLDNVLIDLATGEVVHIDYNVCFEKGRSLRVPEKVPFRMSQNLEKAMGVTGVEGTFRLCCEYVIRTMRRGRETLLTLLEAFVYDPLVDWTTGNEGGYAGAFYGGGHSTASHLQGQGQQSKHDMEKEITRSMFSIRMAEMKASWNQNREEMLSSLPRLQTVVEEQLRTEERLTDTENSAAYLQQQKAYLQEAESDPSHAVFSLHTRYEQFKVVMATRNGALQAVQEKLNECELWHNAHQYGISAIRGDRLQKMCADISQQILVPIACFTPVADFLNGAGQSQLVQQCELLSTELNGIVQQRRAVLHNNLEVLHTYATIVSHFSCLFVEKSRNTRWQHWIQELISEFNTQKCSEIRGYMLKQYGPNNTQNIQKILNTEAQLQKMLAEVNDRLLLLIQRRNQELTDSSMLVAAVQETTNTVRRFVHDGGMASVSCMTVVLVTALCTLSKRYLIMEGAASGAGERLLDLTSRDGDWFLDELCSMSGNVNQLLSLLNDPSAMQLINAKICHQVSAAMQSIHTVYMALKDMNVNFRTIILPETVKTLQSGELSVSAMLESLEQLVARSGQSLNQLIEQLETKLVNAIMGMESADGSTLQTVKNMKHEFDHLLQGRDPTSSDLTQLSVDLTPGQMLLMAFNGLFSQLGTDFDAMLDAVEQIQTPENWRKIDVVKEAQSIQLTAFNDSTTGLLAYLFFIKQLKAMTEFFTLAQDFTAALSDCHVDSIPDVETMTRPIKLFIADYIRKHIIGIPSQTLGYALCHYLGALHVDVSAEIDLRDIGAVSKVSLEELCKKALDLNLRNMVFDQVLLTQAHSLITSNDQAWRKSDLTRRLDDNIALLKTSLQKAQLQLTRFQWLYEDDLIKAGRSINHFTHPVRSSVLSELRKGIQTLVGHETAIATAQERHLLLENSILQRLKWAAGANPSLGLTMQQFENKLQNKNIFIQTEGALAGDVIAIGNAVLHFEALRTETQEAVAADTGFLALLGRCEEACTMIESSQISVSEAEQQILQIMPLIQGSQITSEWIQNCLHLLDNKMTEHQTRCQDVLKTAESAKEEVQKTVNDIRTILTTHHKLMSDIRTILKSLAKHEEQDYGADVMPGSIREYVNTYKTFSENFTTMMKLVMSETLTTKVNAEIKNMIENLAEQIVCIYDNLVAFAPPLQPDTVAEQVEPPTTLSAVKMADVPPVLGSPKRVPASQRAELLSISSAVSSPQLATKPNTTPLKKPDKVTRDPRTGKAIQERNSYAVGVWRRVKTKLDGRDPDVNKRLSVAEQVDYVIKEATNLDNLAVLYEGWTPWV